MGKSDGKCWLLWDVGCSHGGIQSKRLCSLASEVPSSHLSHQAQQENPLYFRQQQINGMSLPTPYPLSSGAGLWVEDTRLGLQNNSLKD